MALTVSVAGYARQKGSTAGAAAGRLVLAEARTGQAEWIAVGVASAIIVRTNSSGSRHTKAQARVRFLDFWPSHEQSQHRKLD